MADIDTNVTALRPKTRDATAAERRRRFRKKRKARLRAPVTPGAQPPVTAVTRNGVTPLAGASIDVAAYAAAIVLAGAAAFFSIKGMVVLFPGAPLAVVVMACAVETAKLVTVGWLARGWRVTAWVWRVTLVALVAGLAIINATGVYAQLVAAHVGERGAKGVGGRDAKRRSYRPDRPGAPQRCRPRSSGEVKLTQPSRGAQ